MTRPKLNFGGLQKRWLLNTASVVLALGLVCVLVITASLRRITTPECRPTWKIGQPPRLSFFSNNLNQTYEEYYQSCVTYAQTYEGKDKIELQFIDSQGNLIASSYGAWAGQTPHTSEIQEAMTSRVVQPFVGKDPDTNERIMAISGPIVSSSGDLVGVLRFVTSTRLLDGQILLVVLTSSMVLLVVMALVLVSSNYYLHSIMNPVAEISEKAKRIANGSYGVQISTPYKDEIGELAETINEMSNKIAQNEKMQAEFISQLSHELRTPLTVINGWR